MAFERLRQQSEIEAERQKALAFRQQSGIVDKLTEFTKLADGLKLEQDDPNGRSTPSSVADRIIWDRRVIGSHRLPKEDYQGVEVHNGQNDNYDVRVTEISYIEKYFIVETFASGTICIRGHEPTTIFGIGNKGSVVTLTIIDWNQGGISRPDVFEDPIDDAYQNPATIRYTSKSEEKVYSYWDKHYPVERARHYVEDEIHR